MAIPKRSSRDIDMLNGPVLRPYIAYAIPIMLSGFLQLLFNAADVVVVGRFAGDEALAAVGSTGSLVTLFTNLFMGLSVGANVAAARACGEGNPIKLSRVVHTSMLLSLICGAVVMVLGVIFAPTFLRLMDTPPEVIDLASVYLRIYFVGMLASMVYNFGAALLRAIGDTKRPLTYLTIAGVANVVLNLIFVIVLHMSAAGVGLATAISQFISAILVVICLMRSEGPIRFEPKKMRIYKSDLGLIVRIGLPAGIQGTVFSISNVIIQSTINSFGAIQVAGNSAGANLDGFVSTGLSAFYQSTMSFTGQNYGARKYGRIWKILRTTVMCEIVIGIPAGFLVWFFGENLLHIYTESDAVVAAGMVRLTYVCLPFIIGGLMDCMVGTLRGIGCSLTPMIVSICGVCGVRLVWIATICQMPQFVNDISAVYISYPISWAATGIMHFICLMFNMKKLKQKAVDEGWDMSAA